MSTMSCLVHLKSTMSRFACPIPRLNFKSTLSLKDFHMFATFFLGLGLAYGVFFFCVSRMANHS